MNPLILFSLLFLTNSLYAETAPTFLIAPKTPEQNQSKNGLKEELGEELETLHSACSNLSKKIAEVQYAVAESQEHLVTQGKTLLNNQPPYKKATKDELKKIKQEFTELTKTVNNLANSLHKSTLRKLPHDIAQTENSIRK